MVCEFLRPFQCYCSGLKTQLGSLDAGELDLEQGHKPDGGLGLDLLGLVGREEISWGLQPLQGRTSGLGAL